MTSDRAQQMEETTDAGERFCLFSVAGEVVGVPVRTLFEVVSEALITPLPEVPAGLVGLMNFRGEILPVVDLGPWIGISVIPRQQVMVVSGGGHQIGVAVDAIRDMVDATVGHEVRAGRDAPRGLMEGDSPSSTEGEAAGTCGGQRGGRVASPSISDAEGAGDAPLGGALRRVSGDRLRGATASPARAWVVDADRLVAEMTQTFSPVAEVV